MLRFVFLFSLLLSSAVFPLPPEVRAAEPEVVVVATEGAFPPFNMVGENGELIGYDMDVVRAVDALLPEVTFKLEAVPWESFFLGLDSGRYDIAVNLMNWTEARAKKYLFGETPYFYTANAIIFKAGRDDIKTVKDLHGKKCAAAIGSFNTTWLEEYNAKNGNPITIEYYDAEASMIMRDIAAGRIDAFLNHPVLTRYIAENEKIGVDFIVAPEFGVKPAFFLYNNNAAGQKYQKLIDQALVKLAADGTLKKLSEKWCGADYTTESAILLK